jgi:type IV secretory pathway VirB3-like protein
MSALFFAGGLMAALIRPAALLGVRMAFAAAAAGFARAGLLAFAFLTGRLAAEADFLL